MLVARLHGAGDVRVSDEPIPESGAETSLIKVGAVGLCGSDLHWYSEGGISGTGISTPLVGGHEFAGWIEGGPRHGELVAVDPSIPCGVCEQCLHGDQNLCPFVEFAGYGEKDGGLQQFVVWPTTELIALPPQLSAADGAMLEPLGVALHAFRLGHVEVGETIAVVGCGPIGLCLIQVARAAGVSKILAVEPLAHRALVAEHLGADLVLSPDVADITGELHRVTRGRGVDVAFEIAGNDDAVRIAVTAARPGARVVLAGIPVTENTGFPAGIARRKGLSLIMSRRMNNVYPQARFLVESGRVDVRSLVSHRFPLDRVDEAFQLAASRAGLKVVVEPNPPGAS
jgi:L-iditol 2-dehydrogenase